MADNTDLPQFVDVRQHGGIASLALVGERGGRLVGVAADGGEVLVTEGRILNWTGVRPVAAGAPELAAATELFENDQTAAAAVLDLDGLWGRACEGDGEVSLAGLAEAIQPDADGRLRSALLRAIVADGLRFQLRASDVRVLSRGEVDERLRRRTARAAAEVRRGATVAWIRGEETTLPADTEVEIEALRQLAVQAGQVSPRDPGAALMVAAGCEGTPLAAFDLLVERGVFDPDENLALIRFGLDRPFSPSLLDEATTAAALARALADGDREDLRRLSTVTVDDEGTREIDDALSLERLADGGMRVGIHLADPGALIAAGESVDREAACRQTTLYLPETTRRMLPPSLGQDTASLVAGADRPALSVLVEFDVDGAERSARMVRSVVHVDRAVPYSRADAELGEGGDLAELGRLARSLQQRRVAGGALETALPEVSPRVGAEGTATMRRLDPATPARKMVAEWMIRANREAARIATEADLPIPYRYQLLKEALPADLDPTDPFQVFQATRCLGQTRTDTVPQRHHGLALDGYTQITSPLRRYLDLVAQRQLAALLRGEPPPLDEDGMRAAIAAADPILARARAASAESREYWQLRWLEGQIGQPQRALVLLVRRRRTRVALLDAGLRTWWRHDVPLEPGQKLLLVVDAAEARGGHLVLSEYAATATGGEGGR